MFFGKKKQLVLVLSWMSSLVVRGDWHQDVFYEEINRFRHSPLT